MIDPDEAADRRLDANAAAGPLAELFTVDLTVAVATCVGRSWKYRCRRGNVNPIPSSRIRH